MIHPAPAAVPWSLSSTSNERHYPPPSTLHCTALRSCSSDMSASCLRALPKYILAREMSPPRNTSTKLAIFASDQSQSQYYLP